MRTNTIIIQTKSTLQVRTELVPVLLHYLTIVIATLPATCRMRPCVCLVLTGLLASTLADQADLLTNTGSVAGLSKYAGIVNKNSFYFDEKAFFVISVYFIRDINGFHKKSFIASKSYRLF